jgi:putative transposase
MAETLRFDGKTMGAVISQEAGRWYVSISVEMEKPAPVQFAKPSVGVDLGLKTLVVLSDGVEYENQVLLRSELQHLKRLSRRLSRRQRGSRRWYKANRQLERFHQRIAHRRADYLHKMTTEIASTYAVIGIEDLNVSGMLKNHRLALSIADAAFGEIRRQLVYKSDCLGGRVVTVGPFYPSSRRCFVCGTINAKLSLGDREWTCQNCGAVHNRDDNAAKNIEVEALRILKQPR